MRSKRLRRWLVARLGVGLAVAVLLLLPPVQKALVRSVVGGIDGLDFDVDRVWAGPWGAELDGLHIRTSVLELEVDQVDADLAFWSSLRHLALDVEQASASACAGPTRNCRKLRLRNHLDTTTEKFSILNSQF